MAINPLQPPIQYGMEPQDPAAAMLEGLQIGEVFRQRRQARELEQKNAQFQADMAAWRMNPSDQRIIELMNMYPEFGEGIRKEMEFVDKAKVKAEFTEGMQALFALETQPQVGIDMIDRRIRASEEAGENTSVLKIVRDSYGSGSPEERLEAIANLKMFLNMTDPALFKQFSEGREKSAQASVAEGTRESLVAEAAARAQTAEVGAEFAEREKLANLELNELRQRNLLDTMQGRALTNRIQLLEEKRAAAQDVREQQRLDAELAARRRDEETLLRENAVALDSATLNTDILLNTLDRIIATPIEVIENAAGPIDQRLPTLRQETADFEALIKTYEDLSFIASIPVLKGYGALSNAEGSRLQTALQNLGLGQGGRTIKKNALNARAIAGKMRENIAGKYGVPPPETVDLSTVPIPTQAPIGVEQQLWDVFTEEEKKEWLGI